MRGLTAPYLPGRRLPLDGVSHWFETTTTSFRVGFERGGMRLTVDVLGSCEGSGEGG